jgi:NAD(P)-dependent dehydrogenase (short-subunit alcohol dehydrogenase family)
VGSRPERPVALVTGGSRGIGLAIARRIAGEHRLVLLGRSEASLRRAADEIGGDVEIVAVDLADEEATGEVADRLAARDEPVQVLINNAGVAPSAPLSGTDDATWTHALAINLRAPFVLARALAPRMVEAGWGRIVNIASTAALKGYPYVAAYSASKGGLLALTRALAAELGRKGVTVNAVCPGFTDTAIVHDAIANITAKTGRTEVEARASLEAFSPLQRLVRPVEIAEMVAWLVGDLAAAVNGTALPIDAGELA